MFKNKKNKTLGRIIGFGFAMMVVVLAITNVVSFFEIQKVEKVIQRVITLRAPTAGAGLSLLNGINHSLAALRGWMIFEEDKFRQERNKAWGDEIEASMKQMRTLSKNWTNPQNVKRLDSIQEKLKTLKKYQEEIEQMSHMEENLPASKILFREAAPRARILTENITAMIEKEKTLKATNERKQFLWVMANFRESLGLSQAAIHAYLIDADEAFQKEFERQWAINSKSFIELNKVYKSLIRQHTLSHINKVRKELTPLPSKIFKIRGSEEWNVANLWLKTRAAPVAFAIKQVVGKMTISQNALMQDDLENIHEQIELTEIIEIILFIIGVGFSIFLAGRVTKTVAGPVKDAVQFSDAVAQGDYSKVVKKSEIAEIEALGKALALMRTQIQERNEEQEARLWLIKAKSDLSDKMRGGNDVTALCGNIIDSLARILETDIGAVYISQEDQSLKLLGSYAFRDRQNNFNEFQPGEGLIGQAALKKTSILFSKIPDDSAKINYGFGEVLPRYFLVVPVVYENAVKAVIALGAVKKFSRQQRDFLDQSSLDIGVVFNLVQSQERIQNLLVETQEQSRVLQASEEQLKAKHEELQTTNKELEENTRTLENQKMKITEKNTALEKAGREIELKAEEVEEASRYKSEFLANMSHELRTPLNSLLILSKGFADNDDGNLSDDQIRAAGVIHSSGFDLLGLINEILDLSKIESGKMDLNLEDIRLEDIILNINSNFAHVAKEKGVELKIKRDEGLPATFKSDEKKVGQILKNLLSNAFKFTHQGSVTVHISRAEKENHLSIAVSDTGIGIPQGKQKIVFEAFKQADGSTKRKYGGTGLGLSISRKFALLLGGEIALKSVEGKGSSFTLILPVATAKAASGEVALKAPKSKKRFTPIIKEQSAPMVVAKHNSSLVEDDRKNLSPEDKVILIVEDDPRFSRILLDTAHKKGFKSLVASDGVSGVQTAREFQPGAIILDIMLPGMDGWGVLDRLKNDPRTRHIPVHFISVLDENIDAYQKGAIGYLSKPVSKEDLRKVFERIEIFFAEKIRHALIVGAEKDRKEILPMVETRGVAVAGVSDGNAALQYLASNPCDCLIASVDLPDMPVFEILNKLQEMDDKAKLPIIIVHTDRELSVEEERAVKKYAQGNVIKEVKSPQRLLGEVTLFLHKVESDLPKKQQETIQMLHSTDAILKGKKILLVDDDMRNTFSLSHLLEKKEAQVLVAENGELALKTLDENPDIDLVLMDIMMPVMDGYQAIAEIRKQKRFARLPVLALTAKAMSGDRERSIEAGASDYLSKPVDIERLFSMMRVWLYQ